MDLYVLAILLMIIFAVFCMKGNIVEGMTGYGTLSGLAYNSKGLYCFKNVYDPDFNPDGTPFSGYCSVIGKVVV
jgi:hypothetical protein